MTIRYLGFAILLLASSFWFSNTSALAQKEPGQVKGEDMQMVLYAVDGKLAGGFCQTGKKTWVEHNDKGVNYYTELVRDEWSVQLDRKGGGAVKLDLFKKGVFFKAKAADPWQQTGNVIGAYR